MKPAPFDYVAVASVEEAVAALSSSGPGAGEAMVLAGGQSLVPLLALRRRRPRLLVDINLVDLDHIELDPSRSFGRASRTCHEYGPDRAISVTSSTALRVGAMVRHRQLERDPVVATHAPLLAAAARWIGSPAIRHRGTLGGSLAHAEPAAELPAAVVALGGEIVVQGPSGTRVVATTDFFVGAHRTALAPDELVVEVRVPAAGPRHGVAFCEWAARHNDLPDAGVAVAVERDDDGRCVAVRAAACGVSTTPLPLHDAVGLLVGEAVLADDLLRDVAARVDAAVLGSEPRVDDGRHDDRAELAGLLAVRAIHDVLAPEGRRTRRPSTRPRPASLSGVGSADAVTLVEGARTRETTR